MGEQLLLEVSQSCAGVHADFFDEQAPRVGDRPQGLGLAARSVESKRELGVQGLVQWVLEHGTLRVGNELDMATECQSHRAASLQRRQPQLVQPRHVGCELEVTSGVEERFAGPQRQAGHQQLVGLGELGRIGRSAQPRAATTASSKRSASTAPGGSSRR